MAHFWSAFCTYFLWSLEFLYVPPFAYGTLLIGLSFIASVIRQRPFLKPIWKKTYYIVVLQFLLFPATLAVAVLGRVDWQHVPFPGPNKWGLRAEDVLALGSLIASGYWVWSMKGLRWFAFSLAMLQLWLLAAANFIAGMSLTGTWL
jgi:hypothetical protein